MLVTRGVLPPDPGYLVRRPGFTWLSDTTAHFRLHAEPGGVPIDTLAVGLERALMHVLSELGEDAMPVPISAFAVTSTDRMQALLGRSPPGRSYYRTRVFAFVMRRRWEETVRHELAHIVANAVWGRAAERWVNEGLAEVVEDTRPGVHVHAAVRRRLVEDGQLLPLDELFRRFTEHPTDVAYLQASSVVTHLRDEYGQQALRRVWEGGFRAIPAATGKSLAAFEAEWLGVLRAAR